MSRQLEFDSQDEAARASRGTIALVPSSVVRSQIRSLDLPPFDPLNTRAAQLRAAGHDVISLGQAVPFFPPPAPALTAAREALTRPETNRYVTDPGLPSLRRGLAARLASTTATAVTPDDLVITAGANHAFTLALATCVDPGDEVILPAPYFTNHQMAVCAAGARPIEAPVADRVNFTVRWTDIAPHVTSRTKAVVLCNPCNPSGAPIVSVEGALIVRELANHGVIVISDETYMHFVYDEVFWSAASVSDWRNNVIVVGTFSKAFGMMGWRVGYLLADAAICREAVKVQDAMIICAPVISQIAAEAAVRDSWSYASSFHDELRRRRQTLLDGLSDVSRIQWTSARAGLFAFVRVHGCDDSAQLAEELLELAHIVSIPGASFGATGEGFLRLSYGYATAPELSEAVQRLRRFFSSTA